MLYKYHYFLTLFESHKRKFIFRGRLFYILFCTVQCRVVLVTPWEYRVNKCLIRPQPRPLTEFNMTAGFPEEPFVLHSRPYLYDGVNR